MQSGLVSVVTEVFLAVEEGHYLGHIGHTEESASHRLGRKRDFWDDSQAPRPHGPAGEVRFLSLAWPDGSMHNVSWPVVVPARSADS